MSDINPRRRRRISCSTESESPSIISEELTKPKLRDDFTVEGDLQSIASEEESNDFILDKKISPSLVGTYRSHLLPHITTLILLLVTTKYF